MCDSHDWPLYTFLMRYDANIKTAICRLPVSKSRFYYMKINNVLNTKTSFTMKSNISLQNHSSTHNVNNWCKWTLGLRIKRSSLIETMATGLVNMMILDSWNPIISHNSEQLQGDQVSHYKTLNFLSKIPQTHLWYKIVWCKLFMSFGLWG